MVWAFWQTYYDYSEVHKDNITPQIYDSTLSNSGIDTPLVFSVLSAEDWSTIDGTHTSRDVHSIVDLGYRFDATNFITDTNFQNVDLNDNWFIPLNRRRRMKEDSNSNSMNFENIMYNRLVEKYDGSSSSDSYDERRQIMQTLSEISCEYTNIGDDECRRPKYFDDFSDKTLGPNMYNNYNDLNVTYDELIDAVSDYPCMVEIRELMFPWVSQSGAIWKLARGGFDRFCDKQFLSSGHNIEDQCTARGFMRP